jgi:hypothetical protein
LISYTITTGLLREFDNYTITRIVDRFRIEAGEAVIDSIREVLGNEFELLFRLDPEYALRKSKDPRLRKVGGKSADQPLIFTREHIYDALEIYAEPDGFVVQIKSGQGLSEKGFDIAEHWEKLLHYMELGVGRIDERYFADLLGNIALEELGF